MIQRLTTHPGPLGQGGRMGTMLVLTLGFALTSLSGCPGNSGKIDVLAKIKKGGDYQDWETAHPRIAAYLLKHPNDFLGHYYYGLSFLHMKSPQLTFAEGEFLTALGLLEKRDTFPASRVGMERKEFIGRLHRQTALTYMRGYYESLQFRNAYAYGQDLLRKANTQVELGLRANPDSGRLQEYATFLREALGTESPKAPKLITEQAGSSISI